MSNFVYDLTSLPAGKSDLVPIPIGADITQYLPAAHWNTHIQASLDLRAATRTGVFHGLVEQAVDPTPTDADAYWWLQDTSVMRLVGPTELRFSGTITAADPTLSTHLATRNYVDTHSLLTVKGDLYTYSTSATRLPVGTIDGQLLSVSSATATGLAWVSPPITSPLTAKGDIYTCSSAGPPPVMAALAVGTNGKLLSANSVTTTGLEWIDPPITTKTLQGAYTDGSTGPQVIDLSTSGKGVKIRDTVAGIGEALFAVQNNTGVTSHFAVNSDGTVTMAGALTVSGVVVGATPTDPTHLTTRAYVDSVITGLSWKPMVRLASTAAGGNVTLSGALPMMDGFQVAENDRVLLKNQTSAIENGIWIAKVAGWTRPTDFATGAHASTSTVFADIGSLNEDTSWFCYTDKPNDVIDTNTIQFQSFSNTISQHNALTGLDGGTSGQYYHLTSAEYTGLHNIATGGIIFASATGVPATDTSNLYWDNSTKQLGVCLGVTVSNPGSILNVKGTFSLYGATSGYVGFSPTAIAGSTTYTLPSADGSSGQALSTNASGVAGLDRIVTGLAGVLGAR